MTIVRSPTRFDQLRRWAKGIKRDVHALYFAARDPRTPWFAKMLALIVAAYAVSPIDLIPDFIPIIGYLDDVILVPMGILLVVRMIPPDVMAEHRQAAEAASDRPTSQGAAIAIVVIWIGSVAAVSWFLLT
jgi:uncharacterized membrane protein YkvA (DUF1232 family)